MAMFQSFKAAPKEDPVDLIKAEIAKAQAEANQLRDRNTNILGAGLLYNKGMGDKSPIYDAVFGAEGAGAGGATEGATNILGGDILGGSTGAMTPGSGVSLIPSGANISADIMGTTGGSELLGSTMAGAEPLMLTEAMTTAGAGEALAAEALASQAALAGGEAAALAGAETAALTGVGEAGLTGALGAAGGAIPPLLMAALLSRALGLWS